MWPILQRMSADLDLSIFTLVELVRTAPYRYKVFTIPKRNGNLRTIAQPARAIKSFQRWIIAKELAILPIHSAAAAYCQGSSIAKNATAHSKNRFLLKLDFKDFFPSIGDFDLGLHLKKYGQDRWNAQEIEFISNIVLWLPRGEKRKQLCIGGPSSPFISNSIMYDFDKQIADFCNPLDVTYTRYADDLAFSTNAPNVLATVEEQVRTTLALLQYPRLQLNTGKTVRASAADRRKITGLTITPRGKVSIGRERKRQIRSKLYHFSRNELDLEDALALKGLLAFCLDAEPGFVTRLQNKFGSELVKSALKTTKEQPKSKD